MVGILNTAALLGVHEAPSLRVPSEDPRLVRSAVHARPWGVARERQLQGRDRHHRRPKKKGGGVVESDYRIYVGIDWASEAHQACVLKTHERRIVAERSFAHAGNAIVEFAQWLSGLADDPGQVAIAIEIPAPSSRPWSSVAFMSTPSTPSSSIVFATGSGERSQRGPTGATRSCWLTRYGPIQLSPRAVGRSAGDPTQEILAC